MAAGAAHAPEDEAVTVTVQVSVYASQYGTDQAAEETALTGAAGVLLLEEATQVGHDESSSQTVVETAQTLV